MTGLNILFTVLLILIFIVHVTVSVSMNSLREQFETAKKRRIINKKMSYRKYLEQYHPEEKSNLKFTFYLRVAMFILLWWILF